MYPFLNFNYPASSEYYFFDSDSDSDSDSGNDRIVGLITRKSLFGPTYSLVYKVVEGPDVRSVSKELYQWEMLPLAAEMGQERVMRILLKEGAKLEFKDNFGRTPLSLAAGKGHGEVVRLLLEKGAKLESRDFNGRTPLSLAAEMGHEPLVKLLLQKGAMLESKDNLGRTPLSLAAAEGHVQVVWLLLKEGAKLESMDYFGRTPLSFAAGMGHEEVFSLLLDMGAALNPKDDKDTWYKLYKLYKLWQLIILLFNYLYSVFFFEWPDGQRLLSTTMPWNIPPSLLVLWGVCWMFAPYGQEMQCRTSTAERFADDIGLFPVGSSLQTVLRLHLRYKLTCLNFDCRLGCCDAQ